MFQLAILTHHRGFTIAFGLRRRIMCLGPLFFLVKHNAAGTNGMAHAWHRQSRSFGRSILGKIVRLVCVSHRILLSFLRHQIKVHWGRARHVGQIVLPVG